MIRNSENQKSKKRSFSTFYFLFSIFCLVLYLLFFYAPVVLATKLYLEPDRGEHYLGETFIEDIRIDTEGECINVIEANLNFSNDTLEVIDFSSGESILTLWLKAPEINQSKGELSFIGGIPGEYCGRIPGDPGSSNLLGKIIFKVSETITQEEEKSLAEIRFSDNSQVFLSDMLGTKAILTTHGADFTILAEKKETPKDQWQEELEKDIIPPEPFEIEINQHPSIFGGKYFIIFSTTDKQTGIDYYEIKEGEKEWKVGLSPYLLEDQALHSIIKVRVIDKAGNERIAKYVPPVKPKYFPCLIVILILFIIGVVVWMIKKLKKINVKKKYF